MNYLAASCEVSPPGRKTLRSKLRGIYPARNKHTPKSRSRRTVNNLSKFDELSGGSQMLVGDSFAASNTQIASLEREI
jgi:hypothetical protein